MAWKDILKDEGKRYRTLNSAETPDPDEKDRFEIDEGDFCINCGNELKEDEGFTNTRLGRKYDDICDACKRLSPHDPNSPYHGS